jgi:hypothetical protein
MDTRKCLRQDIECTGLAFHQLVETILIITLVIVAAACSPVATSPAVSTSTPAPLVTSTEITPEHSEPIRTGTPRCIETQVPPEIAEIQPAEPNPGVVVKVIGSGGYIQDSCGGYNESARTFPVYLDHEPAFDLTCYVNHREGKGTLNVAISPGSHCFSITREDCDYKFQVSR